MPHMTDRSCVAAQYADDRNLSIRMKLHAKHSTAQISMNDWLFAQYDLMVIWLIVHFKPTILYIS